jgi:hypothetical protein
MKVPTPEGMYTYELRNDGTIMVTRPDGSRYYQPPENQFLSFSFPKGGSSTMADQWSTHLGKEITIIRGTDASGGAIDLWSDYNDKAAKDRKLAGKVVGTDGGRRALVMLDKEFTNPNYVGSFTNYGSMTNIAMEHRDEVAKNGGQNRFVWVDSTQMKAVKLGNVRPVKAMRKENQSFMEMMKDDAQEAAFRVASAKIAEKVRDLLSLAIMMQLGGNKYADSVNAMLATPMGVALVQSTAGYALTYAPKKISDDPRVQRLAKEFRVAGMATAGGVVVDKVFDQLAPLLDQVLEMLPGEETGKVRVEGEEQSNVVSISQSEEEESETESGAQKRMAANSR